MYRVGVDIGGTFTDLYAWEEGGTSARPVRTAKVLSTPDDLSEGVVAALAAADIEPTDISALIHGTTTATNALIERKYPEPAMITTRGFRDVIEIGRQSRKLLYDPYQVKPRPLISRRNRFTIDEKMSSSGEEIRPLDSGMLETVAEEIERRNIQSVAVAFINSYRNPLHEEQARAYISEALPNVQVALSAETRPKVRELGRFTTTAVRAALMPVIGDYMYRLEQRLTQIGCVAPLYIVKSNGGMTTATRAREHPEELLQSGPAGGVAAGAYLAKLLNTPGLVVTDVGGTSFEASLLSEGEGLVTDEFEIEWEMPVIVPMLDMHSIGAGGGSIAWIDDGGSLRVGPASAGAVPGPACYGRGSTEPTVTDANLLLGRIDPGLGGKFTLDRSAAETAISRLASKLSLTPLECAEGIVSIVNEHMAAAIRMVSSDRGRDPRDHSLVAFGGAGGLHAVEIARAVGVRTVIVPAFAGVACAFGATTMDVRHDLEMTFYSPLDEVEPGHLEDLFGDLESRARQILEGDGVREESIVMNRFAAMRYIGQSYEVWTPVQRGPYGRSELEELRRSFYTEHKREYGVYSEEFPVAIVTLRVAAIGLTHANQLPQSSSDKRAESLGVTQRIAHFGSERKVDVYQWEELAEHRKVVGPAIVEEADTVVILPPGSEAELDSYQNLIVSVGSEVAD